MSIRSTSCKPGRTRGCAPYCERGVPITRAFKKICVDHIPRIAGIHRFLPHLLAMDGYRLSDVPANYRPRTRGKTKYGTGNRVCLVPIDIFGVLWLKSRLLRYRIKESSIPESSNTDF